MKKIIAISFLFVFALSAFSLTSYNDANAQRPDNILTFMSENIPDGVFCQVEKADVCVIAMNAEDCTKLGGEKKDNCSATDKAEENK